MILTCLPCLCIYEVKYPIREAVNVTFPRGKVVIPIVRRHVNAALVLHLRPFEAQKLTWC